MRASVLLFFLTACTNVPEPQPVADPLAYVSPLMGAGGFGYAAGSAFPGASVPHGLAKPGPDTTGKKYGTLRFLHFSGYWAGDETIRGFSQLHLHGTGATDFGALTLAPVTSALTGAFTADAYASTFSKKTEVASPGFYGVTLDQWNVAVELTASEHVAHHRYTWTGADAARVVLDLTRVLPPGTTEGRIVAQASPTVLRGQVRVMGQLSDGFGGNLVFFEVRSDVPFSQVTLQTDQGAVLDFGAATKVWLQVGLSLVSAEGATANLDAEAAATFDEAKERAAAAWAAPLSRVTVYGGGDEDLKTFYSALHHAFVMPTVISDADGQWAFGGKTGSGQRLLSDFSLWDTYRTVHPLYALAAPQSAADSADSLVVQARALGGFTRWPLGTGETGTMLGSPADVVIGDAVARGAGMKLEAEAWQLLRERALGTLPDAMMGTRRDGPSYRTLGFVPVTESGRSAALTLEYAAADGALASMAEKLGASADAEALRVRSRGWRKLYDPALQLVRARQADGSFAAGTFDPTSSEHFAESNARQNTWAALHDIDGYVELFGGREAFTASLEAFFDATPAELEELAKQPYELRYFPNEHFWAGNEPDIQAPFMFALAGRPDLTAKWSVWARRTFFSSKPDGLPGNDDGGTMASWYALAMLGLYPVPGSDRWIVGSPAFPKVTITAGSGVFTLEARDVSAENIYVQSLELDGMVLSEPLLRQAQIKAGSRLVAKMGPAPR